MIAINNEKVKITTFPNGETLLKIDDILKNITPNKCDVSFKFESNSDLIDLMFIARELKLCGIENATLTIMYMPYSRMDRTEGINAFTLKYVCEFINSLGFKNIEVLEPHSDVSVALLNNVSVLNGTLVLVEDVIRELNFGSRESDVLVYPDQGAAKRYAKQIKFDNILIADKERDFATGLIKNITIHGEVPKKDFRAIIVDDLCSKGGTFILTAKKLREVGAAEIYLVVTHCENTIYDGEILNTNLIDKVYTTDSILSRFESDKIDVVKLL